VTGEKVASLTDTSFDDEVLKSTLPVLVDFFAPWCGPCRKFAPTLNEIALLYENKIKVCKLNVDKYSKKVDAYDIRGVPTLILFKNGKEVERTIGALSKDTLIAKLDELL
jgi:thioredoxin 1